MRVRYAGRGPTHSGIGSGPDTSAPTIWAQGGRIPSTWRRAESHVVGDGGETDTLLTVATPAPAGAARHSASTTNPRLRRIRSRGSMSDIPHVRRHGEAGGGTADSWHRRSRRVSSSPLKKSSPLRHRPSRAGP